METDSDAGSCDTDCWENLQTRRKLQKELEKFVAPKRVKQADMIPVGIKYDDSKYKWEWVYLAPDEFDLFLLRDPVYTISTPVDLLSLAIMSGLQDKATDTTYDLFSDFDGGDMHNNPSDAFHHAYWSALITQGFGADFAKQFTTAHEGRPDSDPNEAFMDLHNNQVGIEVASANPNATDAELQAAVLDRLYGGQLYVWDGKDIFFSDQCPDCWWRVK